MENLNRADYRSSASIDNLRGSVRKLPTLATRFQNFCQEQGLKCDLVPRYALDRRTGGKRPRKTERIRFKGFHTRRVVVNGKLVALRTLSIDPQTGYYRLSPVPESVTTAFVAFYLPDDEEHWLILPVEDTRQSTMFSLSPDLDRETLTYRHHWRLYVDKLEQLAW